MNEFAINPTSTKFVVKNVSPSQKTIKIFNQKIGFGQEYNLLSIPGVSQDDINAALMKGVLKDKLESLQIIITYSELNDSPAQSIFNKKKGVVYPWEEQGTWYIDAVNGNDTAKGDTLAAALKTHEEFMRRLAGRTVNVHMDVNILSNMTESNPMYVTGFTIGKSGFMHYIGSPTTLAEDTLVSVTNVNQFIDQPQSIEGNNDWEEYVGKRLKLTSGFYEGHIAWVAKDLGSNVARTSPFTPVWDTVSAFPVGFDNESITEEEDYVVESLPSVSELMVSVSHSPSQLNDIKLHMQFSNLHFSTCDATSNFAVMFAGCEIDRLSVSGDVWLVGCKVTSSANIFDRASFSVSGGLLSGNVLLYPVSYSYQEGYPLYQGCSLTNSGAFLETRGLQIFDSPGDALTVNSLGKAFLSDIVFGDDNDGYGMVVGAASSVLYLEAPTVTGASGDLEVGGDPKDWTDLPVINATNHALIVEDS